MDKLQRVQALLDKENELYNEIKKIDEAREKLKNNVQEVKEQLKKACIHKNADGTDASLELFDRSVICKICEQFLKY